MRQELTFSGVASAKKPRLAHALSSQTVCLLRLVLSVSALLAIFIDPSEPSRLVALTYTALSLYVLYSAALYVLSRLGYRFVTRRAAYWADLCWYLLFISLSSGTNSVFFFFFFFSILVASFTDGLSAGLTVTTASAALFAFVGYLTGPGGAEFEANRLLLRLTYLLAFGYMIAKWGGAEVGLEAKFALLREISDFSNPRFGIDRMLAFLIEKLRASFGAQRCLILAADGQGGYVLRASKEGDSNGAGPAEIVSPDLAEKLLSIPAGRSVVYTAGRRWAPRRARVFTGGGPVIDRAALKELADLLDSRSLLSVPVRFRGDPGGRLYLLSNRPRAFEESDAAFVSQTLNYIIPVIENIRLVDELATSAADQERQRIARDLHDSVIQPYIGLRIGLSAVRQKLAAGAEVAADIDRLIELAEAEIGDMRSYMRGLKGERAQRDNLLPAVQRFATKFTAATQIDLRVKAIADFRVNDRLAAEIFQIVAEGLSNVRRHTAAKRASVTMGARDNHFCLEIENEEWAGAPRAPFTPRSISERVESLGGRLDIELGRGGRTTIKVKVPL